MSEQRLVELRRDPSNCTVVNLHGATLQSWVYNNNEIIFVSEKAVFDNKKAIRGGVPVVFPCFGPWECGPQHGFARTSTWTLAKEPYKDANGDNVAVFELSDSETTRAMWNHRFRLTYTVTLRQKSLMMELAVQNCNETKSFNFTCLLHTYIKIEDIAHTTVSGLGGRTYIDKVDGNKEKLEEGEPIRITQFTDRIYKGPTHSHTISGVNGHNDLQLEKSGLPDTVVWNPWDEKSKQMSDLGDNEYPTFVCVEPGYVANPHLLEAGKTFTASQMLQILT